MYMYISIVAIGNRPVHHRGGPSDDPGDHQLLSHPPPPVQPSPGVLPPLPEGGL